MAASSSRRNHSHRNASSAFAEDASRLIKNELKCPICFDILLPPIYQCETGHNICYLCVEEVSECPLCKSDYGDTRNYFAEELVNSMTFPCKYEEYGCHKTFMGSQLKDHQANCECQPYRCPELACLEVVGIHQMAKHLDKHGFKVMKGDVHQASIEILDDHFERKTEYNPWRISAFGTEFYAVSTRNREGLWHFWAYGLGVQKDLKKYAYEIVLYSEEKQIMYRGVIQSLRNNPDDIMKNGNCLITTDQVIKSIRKGGRINCQVYFIQGKNWDTARNTPCRVNARKSQQSKKLKKSRPPKEKSGLTDNKKNSVLNTGAGGFTSPLLLSNQSSITSHLSLPPKSRSRRLSLGSAKASPLNIFRKDFDFNGNKISRRVASANAWGKTNKITKTLVKAPRSTNANIVPDDENSFIQRIRETLRCPSCNEVITPPVYQCLIGHNCCHKCRLTRQDCVLCLSPLTDCRNFFAEELLYKTFQRCLYSKHGCKVCLPSAQMKSHEAVCDHAPFECPFNVCRALLRSDDLLEHMKTHQVATVNNELKNEVFVPRNHPCSAVCIIPNILAIDKVAFYPIIVRNSDGTWLFYVITHNYPKYRFELLIKKQTKTLAFQGPVLSLRSKHSETKLKGSALIISDRAVRSLKTNDKLAYQIKIHKLDSPVDGVLDKERALNMPSSWVLTPKSGEIVSKTELFANKKTSVSPNDETDDEDDIPSLANRNDSERDNTSDTDNAESDEEDIPSEDQTFSVTSLATTTQEDDAESEFETNSGGSQRSKDSNNSSEAASINRKSSRHLQCPPRRSVSSMSSKKGKMAAEQQGEMSVEEQPPTRNAASSTAISTNYITEAATCVSMDGNNNLEANIRRIVGSEESLATSLPVEMSNYERCPLTNVPISILKPSSSRNLPSRAGNSLSMHSFKVVRDAFETGSQSQSNSLLEDSTAMNERILKRSKRARSTSKHRVRLSDQVICCGPSDPPEEDVNGNTYSCKSQANLRLTFSKTSVRTVPSKHVLSVQVCKDEEKKREEPKKSEFQQLKHVVNTQDANANNALLEEVDLLTPKSFHEMTDAVISGGFDVVKSVISLFTSESPGKLKESLENVESQDK